MLEFIIIALLILLCFNYYIVKDPHFDIVSKADGKWLLLWYNKIDTDTHNCEKHYKVLFKLL